MSNTLLIFALAAIPAVAAAGLTFVATDSVGRSAVVAAVLLLWFLFGANAKD